MPGTLRLLSPWDDIKVTSGGQEQKSRIDERGVVSIEAGAGQKLVFAKRGN